MAVTRREEGLQQEAATSTPSQATQVAEARNEHDDDDVGGERVRRRTGSKLELVGSNCRFRIVAHRGKVFFQFKSRRNRQWATVFVIGEGGSLGLTSRVTQNYVPRAGEAPRQ